MVLKSRHDLEEAELLVSAVGEDRRTRLNIGINNAVDKTNNKDLEIKNKRISLGDIVKDNEFIIDFQPDIIEQLSMEVVIYAT